MDFIKEYITDSIRTKENILNNENILSQIKDVSLMIISALKNCNKILLCGNGGSAADSQHIAAEFVSRFYFDRPGLSAIALTVDTSILTAVGNDYGYENVFSRQIEALGREGDVLIALSTSGNSPNIIKAVNTSSSMGIKTVSLTGEKRSELSKISDICINVPSSNTPNIQESHIMIGHLICAVTEKSLFSN